MPTAAAPAAVDEHRDFAAHRLHHLDQHTDRRLPALFRATAVVGHDQAVHAVAQRLLGVLAGHDAFQHELALDGCAQAIDELPRHAGAVEVRDLGDVYAVEIGLAADLVGERARLVTGRTVTLVLAPLAEHVLGVAAALPVDRKDDCRGAGALGALHQRLRHAPGVGRIQHEPGGPAVRLVHVGDARVVDRGEDHLLLALAGGTRHGDPRLRVVGAEAADRATEDGTAPRLPKDLHARVDLARV